MLLQTVRLSLIIFCTILCTGHSLSDILENRKCLFYEEIDTEAPKIEEDDAKIVYFNDKLKPRDTQVKYGQHLRLICDIYLPNLVNISWYARSKLLSSSLSNDNNNLDIKSVGLEYHNEYVTCVASMVSNPKKLKVIGAHINIIDLAPPLISNLTANNVTMIKNDKITLTCKIMGGIPQPKVSWQVLRTVDNKFRNLNKFGEKLIVERATFTDDGQYRCIAKNEMGQANRTIDLVVQNVPVAVIKEGFKKTFPYGTTTKLTCRTEGYPLPRTMWIDSHGNKLVSKDIAISWHEKLNQLEIKNIRRSNNYLCYAANTLGKDVASVSVTILSPFIVHNHPNGKTNVHFGETNNIICNITSSHPMKIIWLRPKTANSSELSEIHNDKRYKITANGTVLQIESMDLDQVGNYTCKASLISDENENKSFTTDVQIDDLVPPMLSGSTKLVVMEGNSITISCKITAGVPRPHLFWQVQRHGDTSYTNLPTLTEDLDVINITLSDAGKYQCLAENALGQWTQRTEILVHKAPKTVIDEGSAVTVRYGSSTTFTCRAVGYPLPSIDWKNNAGNMVEEVARDLIVHEHLIISKITKIKIKANDKYFCNAANNLGADMSSVQITVLPFIVHQYPQVTTNVHYKASTNLVCNITSDLPMRIKWFHNSSEIHTSAQHTISANETVLYINSVDLELVGNYKCEASLAHDDEPKEVFSSDVQIDDLKPPAMILATTSTVTVLTSQELSLICKANGNPKPVITWQAMFAGASSYQNFGVGENLFFGSAQAGTYKCTATNFIGEDSRTITVNIIY